MKKLYKFKKWFTVEDAARHLSITAGDEVTEADVLRFALEGHLTLSVYFVNHARGSRGRVVSFSETQWALMSPLVEGDDFSPRDSMGLAVELSKSSQHEEMPEDLEKILLESQSDHLNGYVPVMKSIKIDESTYLNLERGVELLQGVWDLPMWGGERLDVEHLYQSHIGGVDVTLTNVGGVFVKNSDGFVYQLKESLESKEYQLLANSELSQERRLVNDTALESDEALLQVRETSWKKIQDKVRFGGGGAEADKMYYPSESIPVGSIFVVRTEALLDFEVRILSEEALPEKPLHPSERKSITQIIAALAAMANLNLDTPYKAAELLAKTAAERGLLIPGKETVVKFLRSEKNSSEG